MAVLLASQAQRQRDLLVLALLQTVENPGGAGGDRAQFPEDPFGGGEIKSSHFIMTKSTSLPSWQTVRPSIFCPSLKELPISLPGGPSGQKVWADSSVVQQHPGQATLFEQDNVYTVTDAEGNVVFEGNEVGAELKYWNTVFGVDDDVEVVE